MPAACMGWRTRGTCSSWMSFSVRSAIEMPITNRNRSVGAMLSHEVSKRFGRAGLPDGTISIDFDGHTGQSFGFTLAKGISMHVSGDANDGCGNGLSGGILSVAARPHPHPNPAPHPGAARASPAASSLWRRGAR